MPLNNQSSYIPVMQQFLQHWNNANAALLPDAIKLENNYTATSFAADLAALQTAFTTLSAQQATLKGLRNDAKVQRKAIVRRIEQFRKAVLAVMPNSNYAVQLLKTPDPTAIDTKFLQAVDTIQSIWTNINVAPPPGYTGPLKLEGGYLLAAFTADVTALRTAFAALNNSRIATRGLLKNRTVQFAPDRQRMKQYRAAIQARFKHTDSIYQSLPRLSPVPGATPKPVSNLLFVYDATTNGVKITFAPSTSANISRYLLQFCPGATWNATDVQTIDELLPAPPYEFDFKLTEVGEGETGLFKVVVVNATENVRASHVLKIKRTSAQTLTSLSEPETTLALAA